MTSINTLFNSRHLFATGLLVIAYGGSGDSIYFDANSTGKLNTTLETTNY